VSGTTAETGAFYVGGYAGTTTLWGKLLINNSGTLATSSSINIGFNANQSGTVEVSGVGSTWNTTGNLYVGNSGTGRLDIKSGAVVSVTGASYVGGAGNGHGEVAITGGSWGMTGYLFIGGNSASSNASGLVTVTNGTLESQYMSIGNCANGSPGSSGTLIVNSGGVVNTTQEINLVSCQNNSLHNSRDR